MIWLLLTGCIHTIEPLYPDVPPVAPAREEVPASLDDVPGVGFYIPGKPAPFVDAQCRATGRGQVLPQSDSVLVIQQSRDLDFWRQYGMDRYQERQGYENSRQFLYSEAVVARRKMIWGTASDVGVGILVEFIIL
ncbi:MAG: hypothetical protein WC911_02020 [Thermoleophilia bacterium]